MPCSHRIETSPSTCQMCATQWKNELNQSLKNTNGNVIYDCEDFIEELCPKESISKLIQDFEKNTKNLEVVSIFVKNHEGKAMKWEDSYYYLSLCDLSGTIYKGQKYMQEAWEELYLPKDTKMQVLGTLEDSRVMLHCMQWIVLVGEDGCIYAYREKELQLIAKKLREFVDNGKKKKYASYSFPESSDEDNDSLDEDEEIQKIRQSTRDFVNKSANEFEDFLLFLSS